MRRRNRQAAATVIAVLRGDALDVFHFAQDQTGNLDYRLPGRGDFSQVLAAALKDLHPEFIFEQPDLLTHAGLRRIQTLRGRGHIQFVLGNLPDVT